MSVLILVLVRNVSISTCSCFSLMIVYLIGGLLYNKFAKGASGVEMVPNVDFWKTLPGLAKVNLAWGHYDLADILMLCQ